MHQKAEWILRYETYTDPTLLSADEQLLLQKAREISEVAYAPYSNFLVGAALLTSEGRIVAGVNQENASYPAGLCAERVALFNAGVHYPSDKILAIVVAAQKRASGIFIPAAPCGMCRQVLCEFENKQSSPISIIFLGENLLYHKIETVAHLMPFQFGKKNLQ